MKKNSKFKLLIIVLITLLILTILKPISIGATAFLAGFFQTENIDDIEILENIVKIDEETSSIYNEFLIKNTTNQELTKTFEIPIENTDLTSKAENLVIKINNQEVNYTKIENGMHQIETIIPANSYKKIEVNYNTELDLRDAKVIKYNIDSLIGKTIKKIKVEVKIESKDIPLVNAIYPECFDFKDNTISMEYYNAKVNNLTKDFIISKNTYTDLKYNRESELKDGDSVILSKVDEWEKTGINLEYSKLKNEYGRYEENLAKKSILGKEYEYTEGGEHNTCSKQCDDILNYYLYKQYVADSKQEYLYLDTNKKIRPLIYKYLTNNLAKYSEHNTNENERNELIGKKICVDYVETEGDIEFYLHKNITGSEEPTDADYREEKVSEMEILKSEESGFYKVGTHGASIINIGKGVTGEDLGATEEEKIEYMNMIGADFYIRVMIYDNAVPRDPEYSWVAIDVKVGYYNSNDYEIAKAYVKKESRVDYDKTITKLSNETVVNKCKIPTIAHFIGYRLKENDKYSVGFFQDGYYQSNNVGIASLEETLKTAQAQKLLKENNNNNEETKNSIEKEISEVKLATNEKEVQEKIEKQKEEQVDKNEVKDEEKIAEKDSKEFISQYKDYIILGSIAFGIIICVIIITISQAKNKNHKKNKKGEN